MVVHRGCMWCQGSLSKADRLLLKAVLLGACAPALYLDFKVHVLTPCGVLLVACIVSLVRH